MHPRYVLFKFFLQRQFYVDNNIDNIDGGAKKNVKKWSTFVHNGVMFPSEYIPTGINLLYNNKEMPIFKCNGCPYETDHKTSILNHLNRTPSNNKSKQKNQRQQNDYRQ